MITKRSLYSWVLKDNLKLQLLLVVIIVVTVAARVFPLEMQKRIVNEAIGLRQQDLLVLYCLLYLGAVVLAGVLKLGLNSLQTYIGQRTLNKLRSELYRHVLSLSVPFYRRTQGGLVISSLVQELAIVHEFVGSAIGVPLVNLFTLAAFGGYLFWLNPMLAVIVMLVYPLTMAVVPWLQRLYNRANRRRIRQTRAISGLIGEAIAGVHEVHGNASYELEGKKFDKLATKLFRSNVVMQIYKHTVKFTNNFFQGLGPFIIFLVGGWLTFQGRFDLGALVAFLSAQEKLYDPWRELMDFYQIYQDAKVRYGQVMDYFDLPPEHALLPEGAKPVELSGRIEVQDVSYIVGGNIKLLDRISMSIEPGDQVALVGFSGSGKSTLALVVGQLFDYTTGQVLLDGHEVKGLSKLDVAHNVGIVAQHPFIFNGTVRENLVYGCEAELRARGETGIQGKLPSLDRLIETVQQVGLFQDVLRFGLRARLDRDEHADMAALVVTVRRHLAQMLGDEEAGGLADDVEFYDAGRYLLYSSVAVNLTFGAPNLEELDHEKLYAHKDFIRFLEDEGLEAPLLALGRDICRVTVDILRSVTFDEPLFEESPIKPVEFPAYAALADRLERQAQAAGPDESGWLAALTDEDRLLLRKLALAFTPGEHKMVGVSAEFTEVVLKGRATFLEGWEEHWFTGEAPEGAGSFTAFDPDRYLYSLPILENILFGRVKTDAAGAPERINQAVMQALIMENILEDVVAIGMDFHVGSQGDRLSGGQRQKIALARTFLKEPPILILDEATAALDNTSQARIQKLLETRWKGKATVIAVVHRLDTIKGYDKVAVMRAGKIVEMGGYQELMAKKGVLHELVHGSK